MSSPPIFEKYVLPEKNTNRITLSKTQSTEGKIEQVSSEKVNLDDRLLLWILLLLLIVCQTFFNLKYRKKIKYNRRFGIHKSPQVPCKKCRYFAAKNQFLKCAVHPSKVLTAQAVNCSDYCSKHQIY